MHCKVYGLVTIEQDLGFLLSCLMHAMQMQNSNQTTTTKESTSSQEAGSKKEC